MCHLKFFSILLTETQIINAVLTLKTKNCKGYDCIPEHIADRIQILIKPPRVLFTKNPWWRWDSNCNLRSRRKIKWRPLDHLGPPGLIDVSNSVLIISKNTIMEQNCQRNITWRYSRKLDWNMRLLHLHVVDKLSKKSTQIILDDLPLSVKFSASLV